MIYKYSEESTKATSMSPGCQCGSSLQLSCSVHTSSPSVAPVGAMAQSQEMSVQQSQEDQSLQDQNKQSVEQSPQLGGENLSSKQWNQYKQYKNNKPLQWLQEKAKSRFAQYLAVLLVGLAVGVPGMQQKVAAVRQFVKKHWLQVAVTVQGLVIVEAVRAVQSVVKCTKQLCRSAWQTELTSQVCATRANVMEWRSSLKFASEWHQCPLQAAYKLWQDGRQGIPACPANQWMVFSSGQPMSVRDQLLAERHVTKELVDLSDIDSALSECHERVLLQQQGKVLHSQWHSQAKLESGEESYKEFVAAVAGCNFEDHDAVQGLVERFKQWLPPQQSAVEASQ